MADNENSSSVGMVAVIAIIVLIVIVGLFLYRWGGFGGAVNNSSDLNIEANLPNIPGGDGGVPDTQ